MTGMFRAPWHLLRRGGPEATKDRTGRNLTLDAMRGAAALAVAVHHLDYGLAPHGYLAVDFFFALSGLVLAGAYEQSLRAGASVRWFMTLRLARLWPIFAAGILLGTAHAIQLAWRGAGTDQGWAAAIVGTLLNLFMLPDPFTELLYPNNVVFWSIFAELVVNLVFATMLVKLSGQALVAIAMVFAVLLAVMAVSPDYANSGPRWNGVPLGLVRTMFSFTVGMAIARWQGAVPRATSVGTVVLVVLLAAIMVVPARHGLARAFDLLAILVVLPLLLTISAQVEPPLALAAVATFLGDISYPLYAVHRPIALAAMAVVRRHELAPATIMLPYLAISVAAAVLLIHFWDKPARAWLGHRLHQRRSAMPRTL